MRLTALGVVALGLLFMGPARSVAQEQLVNVPVAPSVLVAADQAAVEPVARYVYRPAYGYTYYDYSPTYTYYPPYYGYPYGTPVYRYYGAPYGYGYYYPNGYGYEYVGPRRSVIVGF